MSRLQSVPHAAARLQSSLVPHIISAFRDTICLLFTASVTKSLWWSSTASVTHLLLLPSRLGPVASVGARARLRSAVHRTNTKRYGPRSFRIYAPAVWHKLQSRLRTDDISDKQFTRGLKTYLFVRLLVGGASVNICFDKWTYWSFDWLIGHHHRW